MALESATYVNQLVDTNPPGTDPVAQGDDHLRLIKSTLVTTFPNVGGVVNASDAQLNTILSAVVSGTGAVNAASVASAGAYTGGTGQLVPTGAIFAWYAGTIPTGYLELNGQTFSATTYPALAAIYGTTLPNFSGRTLVHRDLSNVTGRGAFGVGAAAGQWFQALGVANMPPHNHPGSYDSGHVHGVNDPTHAHGIGGNPNGIWFRPGGGTSLDIATQGPPPGSSGIDGTTNLSVAANYTGVSIQVGYAGVVIAAQGSGSAFLVDQPWFSIMWIIKT